MLKTDNKTPTEKCDVYECKGPDEHESKLDLDEENASLSFKTPEKTHPMFTAKINPSKEDTGLVYVINSNSIQCGQKIKSTGKQPLTDSHLNYAYPSTDVLPQLSSQSRGRSFASGESEASDTHLDDMNITDYDLGRVNFSCDMFFL